MSEFTRHTVEEGIQRFREIKMLEWISQLLTILARKTRGCSFCQSTKKCIGEGDDSTFE